MTRVELDAELARRPKAHSILLIQADWSALISDPVAQQFLEQGPDGEGFLYRQLKLLVVSRGPSRVHDEATLITALGLGKIA